MTIGVDVGGTFTDAVRWDGAGVRIAKVSTTPDQARGVLESAQATSPDGRSPQRLLHGTTVATNALLERRGARLALVTDAGFEDLLEIARQDRPSLYDPFVDRAEPLVARNARIGVDGDVADAVARVRALDPDAVAVSLLHAYRDGARERRIAEAIAEAIGCPVSCSHDVAGEMREFERTSTTVLNAFLVPVMDTYLASLADTTVRSGLASTVEVLRSSGGLMGLDEAARLPAAALLSGPAGGVVAAARLGAALGYDDLVSFDMGGTSTDVCRIVGGRPEVAYERNVDGYACRLPSVAIDTVGAGGGSLAWADDAGALRVGPRSAGAHPGPACYGRGGAGATVTDANVLLGRIDPLGTLAGGVRLDADAARRALVSVGERLGLDATSTARGVVAVVEEHMARAVRSVSVEQGADPRGAKLVSFGGAGGLHATALAEALDMAGVIVPAHAGVFSALGLLLSPRRADRARGTHLRRAAADRLPARAAHGAGDAAAVIGREASVRTRVDVRYVGQAHETTVSYEPGEAWEVVAERFHVEHHRRNGFHRIDDPVELVAVRAEASAPATLAWEDLPSHTPRGDIDRGRRTVAGPDGSVDAKVLWRPALAPGAEVVGPAVVEDHDATVWLRPGDRARVHDSGALEVSW